MTAEAAVRAHRLVGEHAPDALVAILAGSTAGGRATGSSDLDIAVLVPEGGATRRETLLDQGRPVELFVHTRTGLAELFAADAASRRGVMQHMYAEGIAVVDTDGEAPRLRAWARTALAEGPTPLGAEAVETRRYSLTDALDDLKDTKDRFEQLAVASLVLQGAADLLLNHHRAWAGDGKWFPRRLLAADPARGAALLTGHRHLCETTDPTLLSAAAEGALHLVGGPLTSGYRRLWPGAARHRIGGPVSHGAGSVDAETDSLPSE